MMIYDYEPLEIKDLLEITLKPFKDERGQLCKVFHKPSFEKIGITSEFGETIVTTNFKKGVVRGLHMQKPPYAQAKALFAATGAFFNVSIDLRKNSPTYGRFSTIIIDSRKYNMVFVPEGFANGYCILEDNTIVVYNLGSEYKPEYETGIRFDSIPVKFPIKDIIVSEKDMELPVFDKSYMSSF